MKIIDLLNKIAKGEEVPKKFIYEGNLYYLQKEKCYRSDDINDIFESQFIFEDLNNEVEIIEEKKKFTKEDFINERMGIDKITRKEFDEMYEVKECNCGMPYCKGFITVDKEEPQEHKIPEKIKDKYCSQISKVKLAQKCNEIIDYLEKKE